jgi:vitamin B12/bleomycin/antimicrobial peptide transport system ATP-binding/permease protein
MRQPLQQFWRIACPYWGSEERQEAIGLLLLLLLLSVGSSSLLIWETLQRGELLSALAAQNSPRFFQGVGLFVVIILLSIPALSFKSYLQEVLGLHWRRWLTDRFQQQYFSDRAFYHLTFQPGIDNPDQRLTEDIRNFTQQALNLWVIAVDSIVQFAGFFTVLWFISKSLLAALLTYAIVGTGVTTLIFGRALIGINREQLKREADFRYGLVRIRENGEAIAFYQGEAPEYQQVQQRFRFALRNFNRLIRWQFSLTLFQNGYQYITFILPFIVLAPRLFAGELEIGVVSQSQAAFERVGLSLGLVITQFDQLSAFMAGIDRLDRLSSVCNSPPVAQIEVIPDSPLALQHLTVRIPQTEKILIQDLSLTLLPEKSLLVMGESGVGKSSLLRTIATLWQNGSGTIVSPPSQLFLPQRPYMILGSLRRQLLYPRAIAADRQLEQVLQQVNLAHVVARSGGLDAVEDWAKILSLGEQQRLAFARLILTNPQYALLDEATSALDETTEAKLYALLRQTAIAFISVGHRPALVEYHQQRLQLYPDQTWSLKS